MAEYKKETKEEGKLIFTELCLIYLLDYFTSLKSQIMVELDYYALPERNQSFDFKPVC